MNVVKCEATVSGGYKYVEEKRGEGQHGCMLYAVCGVLCAVCVLRGTACSYRCYSPSSSPPSTVLLPSSFLRYCGGKAAKGGLPYAPCAVHSDCQSNLCYEQIEANDAKWCVPPLGSPQGVSCTDDSVSMR